MPTYTFVGPKHTAVDYTAEIVFERDADGNVTKNVLLGGTVEMTVEQFKMLSENYIFTEGGGSPASPPVEEMSAPPEDHLANPSDANPTGF